MTAESAGRPRPEAAREIWDDAWSRLAQGAASARHPCHLATLATCADGVPDLRTVVLRAADARQHMLACHTDRRSPKARAVQANPAVAWLFYDPRDKVQLRLACHATLLTEGEVWEARWQASRQQSRLCYTHEHGPGSTLPAPDAYGPPDKRSREDAAWIDAAGRPHFAVVLGTVIRLDWLSLHHDGHRRMRFHVTPLGFDASWIAP